MRGFLGSAGLVRRSVRELRSTRSLVSTALLLAMQVVLGLVASIPIGTELRVSFSFLALAATGALFGPVPALLQGGLADILGVLLKPIGPYFPGFTISAMCCGLIYGLCFYERKIRVRDVLFAELAVDIIVYVLLNTLWLKLLYGYGFFAMLLTRLLKNLIQFPVNVLLLCVLLLKLRDIVAKIRKR